MPRRFGRHGLEARSRQARHRGRRPPRTHRGRHKPPGAAARFPCGGGGLFRLVWFDPRHSRLARAALCCAGGAFGGMMPIFSKTKSRRSLAHKRKPSPSQAAKPDPRLLDAEQFLLPTYKRQPVVMTHGGGAYVYDAAGKKYLDFLGGIAVNALGHAHPRIVKVIRREAGHAIHLSNLFHNKFQGPLAKRLSEWSGLERVFFANSGAEAIDGALKLARLCGRPAQGSKALAKTRILAMQISFHGRTFGAVSVTATEKYRLPFAPLVPGVEFVAFNDVAYLE